MLDQQLVVIYSPLGIVECTFELGKTEFRSDFIKCKNLTRPLILG